MIAAAAARTVGVFVLAALGTASAVAIVPGLVGGPRPVVIESGSMAPALRAGDVVLIAGDRRQVAVGSIVTFADPDRGGLVTHRVVGRAGRRLTTKGDANPTPDVTPVARDDVAGVAVVRVPFAGLPALWISQHRWVRVTAGAVLVAAATEAVRSPRSRRGGRRPASPPFGRTAPGATGDRP